MQHLTAIGLGDRVRNVLACQKGNGLGGGDLHLLVDLAGPNVERAAKDVGEAEDVVHLVRIIRPAGGDDGIGADLLRLFGHDFGNRIGHCEDDRPVGHRLDHRRAQRPGHGQPQKHVGTDKRLFQRARFGLDRMRRFPLVHRILAPLIDHTGAVDERHIAMRHAHALDQFDAGDRRGTGTIRDDADVLHLAAGQVQRVDQPGGGDDGRAVLVVVEDRNLQTLAKLLLDDETFRRLDVFQIDPAEAWRQHRDGIDELVGVMRVDLEVEAVDIGELLE